MPMSPRLLRPRQAGGFDPRTIANLTGWFDATDPTSYTEASGQISEWRDKSGQGNHITQDTANNRPTLFESSGNVQGATQSAINGRQAMFFDGVNDTMSSTNTVTTSHARTVFVVQRTVNNSALYCSVSMGTVGSGSANRFIARVGLNISTPSISSDTTAINVNISTSLSWNTSHLSCWSQNGSTRIFQYFFNGTLYTTTNTPNSQAAFGGLQIGRQGGTFTGFMYGVIGEILIYNREISATERAAVTRWLGSKWGVAIA